ncbi:MAG: hypothetical protein HQM11_09220 [SAR324 cluster bacterium]|nr:hypothetical protein [SAR324 cluster bacterium]
MKPLKEFQNIEIAVELDKGLTVASIARQFSVSESFVRKIATQAGIRERRQKIPLPKVSPEQDLITEVLEQVQDGVSLKELSHSYQISITQIQEWFLAREIQIPIDFKELTESEKAEVLDLLMENELSELAEIYNFSIKSFYELSGPHYSVLEPQKLAVLMEILMDNPGVSPVKIQSIARKSGYDIGLFAIVTYKKRLQQLNRL